MDSIFESENVKLRSITYNELENCNSSKTIPSTKIQREIWASIVLDNNASLSYNESLAIELNESIDSIALNNAFQYLLLRHDSLRCAFSLDGKSFYVKEFAPDNIRYLDYSFKDLQDIEIMIL